MKKWALVLTWALGTAACGGGQPGNDPAVANLEASSAGAPVPAATPAAAAPAFRDVTLPTGTVLHLALKSAIGSDTSKVEDAVSAELRQPVSVDGRTVLPAGTAVNGTVTAAERSAKVKGRARVGYRFDSLRVNGDRYEIRTAPMAEVAAATKGKDATKIGIGAGAGAAIGALLGGKGGAAKGAALGGAGGTGVVLATRGKEVRLGPGASLTTRLTAPLTIRMRVS